MDVQDSDFVVIKNRYSCFVPGASSLERLLRSMGRDTIVLCGTKTNICVESTARDGMMIDLRVVVLKDATSTLSDEEHQASLNVLIQEFADILTVDEVLGELRAKVKRALIGTASLGSTRLDPVTLEILSSRLAAVNDEAAATMRLVSGSPVANEAYDMNVGLMNAEGDCIAIGVYISIHALSLSATVKDIQREFPENPASHPATSSCATTRTSGRATRWTSRSSRRSSSATSCSAGRVDGASDRSRRAGRGPGADRRDVDLG